mgnify:CR=1 FL=1
MAVYTIHEPPLRKGETSPDPDRFVLVRDGFRGDALAINVSMGSEEAGWAGIYLTAVPPALR